MHFLAQKQEISPPSPTKLPKICSFYVGYDNLAQTLHKNPRSLVQIWIFCNTDQLSQFSWPNFSIITDKFFLITSNFSINYW